MHVSIQNGNFVPKYKQCGTCCKKYHCPLCSVEHYKPTSATKLRTHLKLHFNRAVQHEEYTIHRCGLGCRVQLHYHCTYCQSTVLRKEDFENHLIVCKTKQSTTTPLSKQCSSSPKLCPASAEPCTPSIDPCPPSAKPCAPSAKVCAPGTKQLLPSVKPCPSSASPCTSSVETCSLKAEEADLEIHALKRVRVRPVVREQCPMCKVLMNKRNIKKHIERKHTNQELFEVF